MSNRPMRRVACGLLASLALAVLTGCYSYSPLGLRGYPEVLSTVPTPSIAPLGGLIPGQRLPAGVVPLGPQAATPNGVIGSGLMPPVLATPTPMALPATALPVPNYQDPTDSAAGDGETKSSTLRIPANGTLTSGVSESAGDVIQAGAATKSQPPAEFTAPANAQPIDPPPTSVPTINESNYGYDVAGYTWFKGTVEYDKADGAWHLMYAVTPSQNDPYGGDISLADDPRLEALQHNDVIYVTGTLKSGLTDRLGKPRLQIQQLSNITAKK